MGIRSQQPCHCSRVSWRVTGGSKVLPFQLRCNMLLSCYHFTVCACAPFMTWQFWVSPIPGWFAGVPVKGLALWHTFCALTWLEHVGAQKPFITVVANCVKNHRTEAEIDHAMLCFIIATRGYPFMMKLHVLPLFSNWGKQFRPIRRCRIFCNFLQRSMLLRGTGAFDMANATCQEQVSWGGVLHCVTYQPLWTGAGSTRVRWWKISEILNTNLRICDIKCDSTDSWFLQWFTHYIKLSTM